MHCHLRLTLSHDEHRDLQRAVAGLMDLLHVDSRERTKLKAMVSSNGRNPTSIEDGWHALNGIEALLSICEHQSDPAWWATRLDGLGGLVVRDPAGNVPIGVASDCAANRQAQARDLRAVHARLLTELSRMAHLESLLPHERNDDVADRDVTHAEHDGEALVRNEATGQWWLVMRTGARRPLTSGQAVTRGRRWAAQGGAVRSGGEGGAAFVAAVLDLEVSA